MFNSTALSLDIELNDETLKMEKEKTQNEERDAIVSQFTIR